MQFDVVAHRLEHEYGVDAIFESHECATARWLKGDIEPGITGKANPASVITRGVRALATRLLERWGHRVTIAEDGAQGLQAMRRGRTVAAGSG